MAKKTKNWRIKVEQCIRSESQYELTITNYYVYHISSQKPIYIFSSEAKFFAEEDTECGEIENSGVSNIKIFEDKDYLLVTYYGRKRPQKFPLKVPQK